MYKSKILITLKHSQNVRQDNVCKKQCNQSFNICTKEKCIMNLNILLFQLWSLDWSLPEMTNHIRPTKSKPTI